MIDPQKLEQLRKLPYRNLVLIRRLRNEGWDGDEALRYALALNRLGM